MGERLRIAVCGGVAAMPFAGVAWQVLQYLEGFRRLGHEVFYLEDTQRWPYDPVADTVCDDVGPAVAYLRGLMRRCGLEDAWAYRDVASQRVYGAGAQRLEQWLSGAQVLVNLSGVTLLREEHLQIPVRVYLETDPVAPQIEIAKGNPFTIDLLGAHTHHLSYGQNFGAVDCEVPLGRFDYRPTRPPVILDWWPEVNRGAPSSNGAGPLPPFTTVASWHQTDKDIVWRSRLLTWSKDIQFMPYLPLAKRVKVPLELALAGAGEEATALLRAAGWRVRPAAPLSKDIDAYRTYIRSSGGEFSVAKEQYAALRSGWFSDRTACYLAAGRPAIVQDTGFGAVLPTGEGLLAFSSMEEAVQRFAAVTADYRRHCRTARAIAAEHLRAETVLSALLEQVAASANSPARSA
jgi:hypothetical protein